MFDFVVVSLGRGKTYFWIVSAEGHLQIVLEVQAPFKPSVEEADDERNGHVVSLESVIFHKVVDVGRGDRGSSALGESQIARVGLEGVDGVEDLSDHLQVPVPLRDREEKPDNL